LKEDATLGKFSDVGNLAKSYLELQKKIGQKGVIKPGPNDSPEAWKAFREAIGVPPADKYEVKIEGSNFAKETLDWAKKAGAEVGVLPEDMAKIMQSYGDFQTESKKASEKAQAAIAEKNLSALKEEWGDAYQVNLQKALYALKQVDKDHESIDKWLASGPGNDVRFIKVMAAVSKLLGEDKMREAGLSDNALAPSDIDSQIATLRSNSKVNGFYDKNHPMHPSTVQKYESLMKQRFALGARA
jgi:tetratricopeptide (TPR) repeat protein